MVNICIFDAYGTLFDVTSATRIVANEEEYSSFPNHSVKVSNSWRIKQLEYSWLRNIMHEYIDFWQITKDALDFALEENQIKNENLRQRLLDVYWNLSAYPEAQDVLTTLKANNIQTGILSNGSNQMLNSAVVSANLKNYLDKIISVKIVDGVIGATDHINNYSSNHTESIITENEETFMKFYNNIDSAIILKNASTQFADGGEFGFGAEIGISTDKLHVRGPVGAKHLTTFKYIVHGNGQARP